MLNSKNMLILALCGAVLIISSFYLILTAAGDGTPAIAEPDVILYLQYARNIAEGHSFTFSPGDTPSTGSTSYLYPLLLSLLYQLGATGDAFITAVFILNAGFYLGIIVLLWLITKRLHPRIVPLVLFMTVLSGHTASAVLRQTDIGLLTFLALATFTSILYGRRYLPFLLIALCAITRPEGFVFSIAFISCSVIGLLANRFFSNAPGTTKQSRQFLLYGITGAVVFLITLIINYRLTGHFQFMSVANKGYFKVYPLTGAVEHILYDAVGLLKGVFFGLSDKARQFYLLPLIGGALGLAGILLYPRKDKTIRLCECWLALSAGAAIALVASSQWQGISNDRYLGWIFPLFLVYVSIGVFEVHDRLKAPYFLPICTALLLLYQIVFLAYVFCNAYTVAITMEKDEAFAGRIAQAIPTTERFGYMDVGGVNYYLPEHQAYNLWGITAPGFFEKGIEQQLFHVIDLLKHRPDLRFENWITYLNVLEHHPWTEPFMGEARLTDSDSAIASPWSLVVYKAVWDTLDGGNEPLLLGDQLKELKLIDSMDIGYIHSEEQHNYKRWLRLKNMRIPLVTLTAKLGDKDYSEVGRAVIGSESFDVGPVQKGKPLYIAMRTARTVEGTIYHGRQLSKIHKLELDEMQQLKLFVDDVEVPVPELAVGEEGFSEVLLKIPPPYLQSENPRIMIGGDHISFAYWFYQ
ncbi:MAG: hypothetical protein K9M45_03580 [Kiritimatiellales bacterium]|nr:hypothetical protein [Kiritimatiellales bacterium]